MSSRLFLEIHREYEADEYGRLGIMHALPAPIAYMMCRMRKNELEAIAENSGRELIGTKRTEYTNLVHKMDEIRPILMQLREQYPGEFEIDRVLGDEDEDLWAAD